MSVCLTMSGQQINHRLNSYRSGEMLMKQRVETDIDELLGSKCDWSLDGAEVSRKRYIGSGDSDPPENT